MSAGALTGIITGSKTAAEAAARQAVYERAQARINAIRSHEGVALKPGETAPAPSVAAKNAAGAIKTPSLLEDVPFVGPAVGAAKAAGETVEAATGGLAGEAANDVGESLINWVKPVATKVALYAVFILGSVAMVLFGLSELLKPVGGPNLAGAVGGRLKGKGGLAGDAELAAV